MDVLDADRSELSEVDFATRPTQRFHGSIPALVEAHSALMEQDARVLIAAPNQGEVERLASLLQEYQVPYRLGSRTQAPGSETVYSESSYLAGDLRTPVIVRAPIANGVQVLDLRDADGRATARQVVIFGAKDLVDDADVQARPVHAQQVEDVCVRLGLSRSRRRRLRGPRGTRHRALLRAARD